MLAMAGIASAVGKFVYGDEKVEYRYEFPEARRTSESKLKRWLNDRRGNMSVETRSLEKGSFGKAERLYLKTKVVRKDMTFDVPVSSDSYAVIRDKNERKEQVDEAAKRELSALELIRSGQSCLLYTSPSPRDRG